MSRYKFKALDGQEGKKEGVVEAANEKLAADALEEKGYSILSLQEASDGQKLQINFLNRVSVKDLVIFSRQFSVMISANVAMVQALKIVTEQTNNPKLKIIISEIAGEVDSGAKLSDALGKRPEVFSNFFVSVVRSGETSGKLEEVLVYLADEMEKDYDMMSKIKGAMIYPAFVLCGLFAVGILMMVVVVPKLTAVLEESGAALPVATKILIFCSKFLQSYWWLLIIILVLLAAGAKFFIASPPGRRYFDYLKLKAPIFGKLFQKIYLVRFTRSLNTLIVGGVPIADSLKITAEVVSNNVYQNLIRKTIKEVEDGNSISNVFINSKEIPKMVSQMMNVGEKTGKLDLVLERLTEFYAKEVGNTAANLITLMEPLIMVVMGIAVGIMVAAIIMPMYNMAGQF